MLEHKWLWQPDQSYDYSCKVKKDVSIVWNLFIVIVSLDEIRKNKWLFLKYLQDANTVDQEKWNMSSKNLAPKISRSAFFAQPK